MVQASRTSSQSVVFFTGLLPDYPRSAWQSTKAQIVDHKAAAAAAAVVRALQPTAVASDMSPPRGGGDGTSAIVKRATNVRPCGRRRSLIYRRLPRRRLAQVVILAGVMAQDPQAAALLAGSRLIRYAWLARYANTARRARGARKTRHGWRRYLFRDSESRTSMRYSRAYTRLFPSLHPGRRTTVEPACKPRTVPNRMHKALRHRWRV